MPFKRRPARKTRKRYQKQNTKRNTKSMQKYGENYKQNPRLILNTIQPANYVPQSITIRHTYDNTMFINKLTFVKDSQENFHVNFLPNSLLPFSNGGALQSQIEYGREVNDVFDNDAGAPGRTTVLDDTLNGAQWASRYKKAQVMAVHYNFNIRQINTSATSVEPEERIQPVLISLIRAHQQGVITNTTTVERIQKLAFTQTRFLGKGRNGNDAVINLKCAHYPPRS